MPRLIITAANAADQIRQRERRIESEPGQSITGCLARRYPYCSLNHTRKVADLIPISPRPRWHELIIAGEGTFLHDATKNVLPPHDQGGTNYCWAHGSVRAVEALRIYEGQTPIILSAESVAVPLTGGRNRGGSPDEAVQQLQDYGCCDQIYWPKNQRNQHAAADGWEKERENHCILDWIDVLGWDAQITLALHRIPVAIGLAWWGHLVCQLDPVILPNGEVGIGFDNSWGADYGENGYAYLDEQQGTADLGAFAPLSETFSLT